VETLRFGWKLGWKVAVLRVETFVLRVEKVETFSKLIANTPFPEFSCSERVKRGEKERGKRFSKIFHLFHPRQLAVSIRGLE
jgi:hypothetical protein